LQERRVEHPWDFPSRNAEARPQLTPPIEMVVEVTDAEAELDSTRPPHDGRGRAIVALDHDGQRPGGAHQDEQDGEQPPRHGLQLPRQWIGRTEGQLAASGNPLVDHGVSARSGADERASRPPAPTMLPRRPVSLVMTCAQCREQVLEADRIGDEEECALRDHLLAVHPNTVQPETRSMLLKHFVVTEQPLPAG
jgi:hypothetical protein